MMTHQAFLELLHAHFGDKNLTCGDIVMHVLGFTTDEEVDEWGHTPHPDFNDTIPFDVDWDEVEEYLRKVYWEQRQ